MTRISGGNPPAANAGTASHELQLVVFRLDRWEYGVEVNEVLGIYRGAAIIPTPDEPDYIVGEVYLRGDRIPVVSLRQVLNLPSQPPSKEWLFVLRVAESTIAVVVDQVTEVIRPESGTLRRVRLSGQQVAASDYILAAVRHHHRTIYLPDLPRMFSESMA